MSCFSGYNNLGMSHTAFFFVFFFFMFLVGASVADIEGGNILNELYSSSSRDEMVELAGYGHDKLSTVVITGTLICEAHLDSEPRLLSWPIPGARVVVHCHTGAPTKKTSSWSEEAITDEYGDFLVDLPSHLHAVPHLDKACSLRAIRLPRKSMCQPESYTIRQKRMPLLLLSVQNGIRTYTAGNIKFLHSIST